MAFCLPFIVFGDTVAESFIAPRGCGLLENQRFLVHKCHSQCLTTLWHSPGGLWLIAEAIIWDYVGIFAFSTQTKGKPLKNINFCVQKITNILQKPKNILQKPKTQQSFAIHNVYDIVAKPEL